MNKTVYNAVLLLLITLLAACVPGEDLLQSDAYLNDLTLSDGIKLDKEFDSNTTNYSADVSYDLSTIEVRPVTSIAGAEISVNGIVIPLSKPSIAIHLVTGKNSVLVTVKNPETSNRTTYIININRQESLGPQLTDLQISAGELTPPFSPEHLDYSIELGSDAKSINLVPTAIDENSSVYIRDNLITSGEGSADIQLPLGTTSINIVVKSKVDSTRVVYTININRTNKEVLSSEAQLTDLQIGPIVLDSQFDPAITQYTAVATNEISDITLIPSVDANSGSAITINDEAVVSGDFSTYKLIEGTNTFKIKITSQDLATFKSYLLTITRLLNNNANLSDLTIDNAALKPSFSKYITNYSSRVVSTIENIEVAAAAEFPSATVTINGQDSPSIIALKEGTNRITIQVISHDGSTIKDYEMEVYREPLGNADLSQIDISSGMLNPKFSRLTTSYTTTVGNSITNFYVTPRVWDPTSTIEVLGVPLESGKDSQIIPLNIGSNEISINVNSANLLATKTYTINVIREGSGNNAIASLDLSAGSVSRDYEAGQNFYTAIVGYDITSMSVTPTVVDPKATISVNAVDVESGTASNAIPLHIGNNNIFTIIVTAEDGTKATYQIDVTRQGSSNAKLSNITLSSGTMNEVFNSEVANYTQTIANGTTSLTVTPISEDAGATIKVNNTLVSSGSASNAVTLANGINLITVEVTAADASTVKRYKISVEKHASNNANLRDLTISESSFTTAFSKNTISYDASVEKPITSITVTPTVEAIGATVKVNGFSLPSGSTSSNIPLAIGSNTILVDVTSIDTTTSKTYTINIERLLSKIVELTDFTIPGVTISPAFDANTTSYTATVPNETNSVTGSATLLDTTGSFTINTESVASGGTSSPISLLVGNSNVVDVLVTAEDGVIQKNYSVRIRRLQNTNADLGALALSDGTLSPAFDPSVTSYTATVRYTTNSITVTPTTFMPEAYSVSVKGTDVPSSTASSPISLCVCSNSVPIVVTAEDVSFSQTYSLAVTRQAASGENRLSNLTFSAGTLSQAFDPVLTNYIGNVSNSASTIDVTPTLWDSYATVKVNGISTPSGVPVNIPLSEGSNTIQVSATSENGTTNSYTIIMNRALSDDATLSSLTLGSLILSPAFDGGTTAYTTTATNLDSDLLITPIANHRDAISVINGMTANPTAGLNLDIGANTINVVVTAQDSVSTNTYTITLNRPTDVAATNADLSDLIPNSGDLDVVFDPNTLSYSVTAGYVSETISFTATKADQTATISVNGIDSISGEMGPAIDLTEGSTTPVSIIVTAGDGSTTKTYTINVTRENAASFAQRAYIKASNTGASDYFGMSVAISGDTMVVGAPYEDRTTSSTYRDTGAAYIFVRDDAGIWTQEAMLRDGGTYRYDYFGRSVAIWGDVVAIGTPGEDSNVTGPINAFAFPPNWTNTSAGGSGGVHIYKRTAGVWTQEAFIKSINTAANDSFGTSIALSENTLVVGAPGEDSGSSDPADNSLLSAGAAYTYTRSYDSFNDMWIWSFEAYHKSPFPNADDRFGYSVAIDGDTFVVGAQHESSSSTGINSLPNTSAADSGAVFVFTRSNGSWNTPTYIKPDVVGSADNFGSSVDIYGDVLIVGAPGEDSSDPANPANNSTTNAGAAYIFTRNGTVWSQTKYLKPTYNRANSYYGVSVAVGEKIIAVGHSANESGATGIGGDQSSTTSDNSGAVFLYTFNDVNWIEDKFIKQNYNGAHDSLGGYVGFGTDYLDAVDIDGDTIVAGAIGEDSIATGIDGDTTNNSASTSGATYTFK